MRRVDAAGEFIDALDSCKREAASSFGDDRVILEKYILSPRHIEVQVFGDSHGNVVHLFERDCSLQRRHQKVIEEAPAPGMDAETREAVCAAAVRAAKAVNYEGAGTIEFIADASQGLKRRPHLVHGNEHAAAGRASGDRGDYRRQIWSNGSCAWRAVRSCRRRRRSCRSPAMRSKRGSMPRIRRRDFLPSVGRLDHFDLGEEGRIESGVEEGDAISPYYDPMIAKLIVHADNREDAIGELAGVLDGVEVWPVHTNAGFLFNALLHPGFGTGEIDTGFIAREIDELVPDPEPDEALWRAAAAVVTAADDDEPLAGLVGFRLNAPEMASVVLGRAGEFRSISLEDGDMAAVSGFRDGERVVVFYEGNTYAFDRSSRGSVGAAAGDGAIVSPMPGRVTAVDVAAGEKVTKGQRLLTLEAMKMEHGLIAPFDGEVAEFNAAAGAQVGEGAVLARIEIKKEDA